MSTIRELAESAYLIAAARPTSNAGIDVIEDAIQAAVNDHTRALADALEALTKALDSQFVHVECTKAMADDLSNAERAARVALLAAGRLTTP